MASSPNDDSSLNDDAVIGSQKDSQKAQFHPSTTAFRNLMGDRTVENYCPFFLSKLRPDMRILDVGCGPGSITTGLARQVPHGQVVGLDASTEYLDYAKGEAKHADRRNITFVEGDVHALPFEDDSFDVAHAHQVLLHLNDPVQALREMRRVVKNNGLVVCRDAISMSIYPESAMLTQQRADLEVIARKRGGHPDAGKYTHVWARQAGFEEKDIEWKAAAYSYFGKHERSLWVAAVKSASKAIANAANNPEQVDEIMKLWDEWGERDDAWHAGMDGQILCKKVVKSEQTTKA